MIEGTATREVGPPLLVRQGTVRSSCPEFQKLAKAFMQGQTSTCATS